MRRISTSAERRAAGQGITRDLARHNIFSDTTDATEVEVRFVANGDGTTRVELEHRGWDTFDGGGGGALTALAVYIGQPSSMHLDS